MGNQEMQGRGIFKGLHPAANGGSSCSAGCSFVREIQGLVERIAKHCLAPAENPSCLFENLAYHCNTIAIPLQYHCHCNCPIKARPVFTRSKGKLKAFWKASHLPSTLPVCLRMQHTTDLSPANEAFSCTGEFKVLWVNMSAHLK